MNSTIRSFRDLRIWSGGIDLVKLIYQLTSKFPQKETYGLASQMQRAAVSIPSNIAEGHIRAHTKEFLQFLYMALGSCAELETQCVIAKELGYSNEETFNKLLNSIEDESRQIRGLILKLIPNPKPLNPR